MKRRSFVKTVAGIAGITIIASTGKSIFAQSTEQIETLTVKGNIRQSVSKWCFGKIPLDEFCKICKKLGMVGVDLIGEKDWDTVNKNDMIVTMGNGAGSIPDGFNRIENHEKLIADYERIIPIAAEKKVPNIICFSGNRKGMDDELGLENCAAGLKKLMPTAEKYKVNIVMELLNSKNHKDYMADTTPWGGTLARKVGSERFKLLYDIFHMQRMEGDIIQMIRDYKDVIGHYHTGGNPGRNDIDETQEIYYPAVMKAIVETGYKGFVAHEFIPKDGLNSLRKAVQICDV
ncbi:hydroxypyruvate isomerase [Planctomycetales bacterium]|nr:hydroxypyruvate isomerase [Planctomycetales bacterium]